MAVRVPLVMNSGKVQQLQAGDTLSVFISANVTYYVATTGNDSNDGSSGSPWLTISHALAYLNGFVIAAGVSVTVSVGDGEFAHVASLNATHPQGSQIYIIGTNTYSKTSSSIQSSSGSSGAWSIIVNLNNVDNIAVNDYVLVSGASGGTRPHCVLGVWKVTNVDTGNKRITIATTIRYASAPSGNVVATFRCLKSILTFTDCSGVVVSKNNVINIASLMLVGNSTNTGVSSSGNTSTLSGGLVLCGSYVGVAKFKHGLRSSNSGSIFAENVIASSNGYGFYAEQTGNIQANSAISSGNDHDGFDAVSLSQVVCNVSRSIGNGGHGYLASTVSSIFAYNSVSFGNTSNGFNAGYASCITANVSTSSYNGNMGCYVAESGTIVADSTTITNNTNFGLYARTYGYMLATSATVSSNGTDYSPSANTQGNEYGYIDT